jgi:hypothetical protein
MESPRVVCRLLVGFLAVGTVAVAGVSVWFWDWYVLIGWVGVLAIFSVACATMGILNVVIFAPVFWLMSKVRFKTESNSLVSGSFGVRPSREFWGQAVEGVLGSGRRGSFGVRPSREFWGQAVVSQ